MISKVRTAESAEELLAMQREVDAMMRETLACYDDGAIEEEDLVRLWPRARQFHHAVGGRRAAMGGSDPSYRVSRAIATLSGERARAHVSTMT